MLDALVGATSSAATRETFRRKLRAGELDDKEIEIELPQSGARHADVRTAQHARRLGRRDQPRRHLRQGDQRTKPKRMTVGRSARAADRGRSRKAARPGPDRARRDRRGREQRHRLPRRDRQDLRPRGARRRRRLARGRAARSAAADRGHDGRHQARRGQDGPYPVHRFGAFHVAAPFRPSARTAGPPADPRRTEFADRRRLQAHPDRHRGEPHQAICGADAGPKASISNSPTTRSRRSRASPPRSTAPSRTSARAACRR